MKTVQNYFDPGQLEIEATVFARYLIGCNLPSHLVKRYIDACRMALPPAEGDDENIVRLAIEHPLLLPSLDAVTALRRPKSRLRQKLLLMSAILEASPDFTDRFLPERSSLVRLALLTVSCGLKSACKVAVGMFALVVLRVKI
jgi:hypothetical protein